MRFRAQAASGALLLVLLTACGGTDSTDSSAPAPPSASEPAGTADSGESSAPAASASPSAPADEAATEARIVIKDFDYEMPQQVAAGATVTVTNEDAQSHTVTSKEGGFDVVVQGGETVTFDAPAKAGSYKVICNFHGNMKAQLVVA